MDQPAIYSETLCERVMERRGERAKGRLGDHNRRERLKTGAADLRKELCPRRAEFFALPILHVNRDRCWLY